MGILSGRMRSIEAWFSKTSHRINSHSVRSPRHIVSGGRGCDLVSNVGDRGGRLVGLAYAGGQVVALHLTGLDWAPAKKKCGKSDLWLLGFIMLPGDKRMYSLKTHNQTGTLEKST